MPVFNLFRHLLLHRAVQLRIGLQAAALHQAGGDNRPAKSAEQAHQRAGQVAVANHGNHDHEPHAKGSSKVGEGNELVLLEIGAEGFVLGQGDDGRIVRQEGHHGTQRRHAGKIVERLHERAQEALQERHHAKLRHQLGQRAREYGNAHQVEHGIEQEVVRRVHDGFEHVAAPHAPPQQGEYRNKDGQKNECLYG